MAAPREKSQLLQAAAAPDLCRTQNSFCTRPFPSNVFMHNNRHPLLQEFQRMHIVFLGWQNDAALTNACYYAAVLSGGSETLADASDHLSSFHFTSIIPPPLVCSNKKNVNCVERVVVRHDFNRLAAVASF